MTEVETRPTALEPTKKAPGEIILPSLVACLWYALPDYVARRKPRAAVKAALLTAAGLYGAHLAREASDVVGLNAAKPGPPATGLSALDPPLRGLVVLVALVGLTSVSVAAERSIYQAGEGLAERGVKHPHTKIGLTLGTLTPLAQRGMALLDEAVASRSATSSTS